MNALRRLILPLLVTLPPSAVDAQVATPRPDFVIKNAGLKPSPATPYDPAALTVEVANVGNAAGTLEEVPTGQRHFVVQVYHPNGQPVKGWTLGPAGLPVTVAPGTSQLLSIPSATLLTDVVGDFLWDITLNSFVTESNAGNNTLRIPVTVLPRPKEIKGEPPDLIASCDVVPLAAGPRDRIRLLGRVANEGSGTAAFPPYTVLARWNTSPALAGRFNYAMNAPAKPIRPGDGREIDFELAAHAGGIKPGEYRLTLVADADNRVGERDDKNNAATCRFTVSAEDVPREVKGAE